MCTLGVKRSTWACLSCKITKPTILNFVFVFGGVVLGNYWKIYEISMPNLVTNLKQMPISEWCMVRWGFTNMTYQKVMCLKEIEPCDQNLLTILLDSTFNLKIGKLHGHLMRTCIFTLII